MTPGTSLQEDIVAFENAGLAGIGLSELKIDEFGRERSAAVLANSSLEVTSVDWIANFTGFNAYKLDDVVKQAVRLLRFASRVGAKNVTVLTGPRNKHTKRHSETLVVDTLRTLGRVAEDCGVDIAVMPMNRDCSDDWTFLHCLGETIELLERVDSANVGMLYHTYHLAKQAGLPTLLAQPDIAKWIKLVRIADWDASCQHENDQRFPGEGSLPLAATLGSLQRAGYDGYYEVDVWSNSTWQREPQAVLRDARAFCETHIPAPKSPLTPVSRSKNVGINSTFEAVLRPA